MKIKTLLALTVLTFAALSSHAQSSVSTFRSEETGLTITLETSDSINSRYTIKAKDGSERSGSLVLNPEKLVYDDSFVPKIIVHDEKVAEGSACSALEFSFAMTAATGEIKLAVANLGSAETSAKCLDARASDYRLQK